jgi:hypothetical protein
MRCSIYWRIQVMMMEAREDRGRSLIEGRGETADEARETGGR